METTAISIEDQLTENSLAVLDSLKEDKTWGKAISAFLEEFTEAMSEYHDTKISRAEHLLEIIEEHKTGFLPENSTPDDSGSDRFHNLMNLKIALESQRHRAYVNLIGEAVMASSLEVTKAIAETHGYIQISVHPRIPKKDPQIVNQFHITVNEHKIAG